MNLGLVFWKNIFKGCMSAHFCGSHMKPDQSLLYSTTVLYETAGLKLHQVLFCAI